jgi:hypothetical protein
VIARCWQTGYNTARYYLYKEPGYAYAYPPLGLEELRSKLEFKDHIVDAVLTPAIQKRIQDLRKEHVITLAKIAYDPEKVLKDNSMADPFKFNSYHLLIPDLGFAIFRTLVSTQGFRLRQLYRDAARGMHKDGDVSCLIGVEEEWMEVFSEDERDWVRLILHVLWVADLDAPKDTVPKVKRSWKMLWRRT